MGKPEGHGIGTHRRRSTGWTPESPCAPDTVDASDAVVPPVPGHRVRARMALAVLVILATVVTVSAAELGDAGPSGTRSAGERSALHRTTRAGAHLLASSTLPSRALYGWGGNDAGQVGNGAVGGGTSSGVTLPVGITAPVGQAFASISAGSAFTVGVTTSGRVYAWGAGSLGQLGDGAYVASTVPMPVALPAPPGGPPVVVTTVAAGSAHALALTSTGRVYAWGADVFGQLGNGTTVRTDVPTPVVAPAGVTFTAVAAGGDHSMALASDGRVFSWGANYDGQVGDGTTTARSTPTAVVAPSGVAFAALAAGTAHSLAVATDGSVYAWGFNASGQLGTGTTTDAVRARLWDPPAATSATEVPAGMETSWGVDASVVVPVPNWPEALKPHA